MALLYHTSFYAISPLIELGELEMSFKCYLRYESEDSLVDCEGCPSLNQCSEMAMQSQHMQSIAREDERPEPRVDHLDDGEFAEGDWG